MMAIDWLKTTVSDDLPSGPDLAAEDDEAFSAFYYEAEGDLPERYFVPGLRGPSDDFSPGTVFDPRSVPHAKSRETVLALLKRSRDLRLLSLMARQQILAGRLDGFVEAVSGIADLLESQQGSVHPQDVGDRRGTLEELANLTTVQTPLQYLNIAGAGEVTLRRFLAANKQVDPREGEVGLNAGSMVSNIAVPGNKMAVDAAHRLLTAGAEALTRIRGACIRGDRPFTLGIGPTLDIIAEIQKLIAQGRPDLEPSSPTGNAAPVEASDAPALADGGGVMADSPAYVAPATPILPAQKVSGQGMAKQALTAIEIYFVRNEPSSAALLLVIQARLLVGKPLIEAIETLLPEDANKTRIDFGPETGFSMSMDRLRLLSAELAKHAPPAADETAMPLPDITSRAEVASWLRGVDEYFRIREPASPIPLLLSRAKAYLDKDFGALISELMPGRTKV
jgi:type VI secretion system protein ImpA